MRKTTICSLLTLSAALLAASAVNAQSAPPAADIAPPPPETQRLEQGDAPAVTIRQPETKGKITEKKSQGRVTEVKVQTGRSTYYAHPNDPAGSAMRSDAQSDVARPVQFKVGEFGPPKHKEPEEPAQTLPPNPGQKPASGK
jgi:hypothetical protein